MSHIDRLAVTEITLRMTSENIQCKHAMVVQNGFALKLALFFTQSYRTSIPFWCSQAASWLKFKPLVMSCFLSWVCATDSPIVRFNTILQRDKYVIICSIMIPVLAEISCVHNVSKDKLLACYKILWYDCNATAHWTCFHLTLFFLVRLSKPKDLLPLPFCSSN